MGKISHMLKKNLSAEKLCATVLYAEGSYWKNVWGMSGFQSLTIKMQILCVPERNRYPRLWELWMKTNCERPTLYTSFLRVSYPSASNIINQSHPRHFKYNESSKLWLVRTVRNSRVCWLTGSRIRGWSRLAMCSCRILLSSSNTLSYFLCVH